MKRIPTFVLVAAIVAGFVAQTDAFVRLGGSPKWTKATVSMGLRLGTTPVTLIDKAATWNKAAAPGITTWNAHMKNMKFSAATTTAAIPGSFPNGKNNVFFSNRIFGSSFGGSTLAVCVYTLYIASKAMFETDIIFNTKWKWNSYRGALRSGIQDIRRVTIHEAGHALGLGHSGVSGAIMRPVVSSQDKLGADDIKGANAIYGKP